MSTKFKLTWRREGRWRKKYKGRSFYFIAPEGKLASYQRCYGEWLKKKAEIDQQDYDDNPDRRAWRVLIARASKLLAELSSEDTQQNRQHWSSWYAQLCTYQYLLEADTPFPFSNDAEKADPSNVPWFLGGGQILDIPDPPPPWEQVQPVVDESKTLQGNVDRFLRRKRQQTERGQLSHGRYDSLRVSLETFADHVGATHPIASINGKELSGFHDQLEKLVDGQKLSPHSARDRLQGVKQFVRWAWSEELMGLPRILESREFAIALPEQRIKIFKDEEIRRVLDSSSDSTKLYLLLMLNCGMQQQDIAELRQDEVDWKQGRITRQRSKTRKRNVDTVPTVKYPLWPETFRLLKQYRSKHPKLALTNSRGMPLKTETIVNGRVKKIDNIRSAYRRVIKKLADAKTDAIKIGKPLKLLRKTAATKLGEHPEHSRFAQHFLGHAPTTVADRHYVSPSESQFDKAIDWLGTQFSGDAHAE